jgi:hypothetical protein
MSENSLRLLRARNYTQIHSILILKPSSLPSSLSTPTQRETTSSYLVRFPIPWFLFRAVASNLVASMLDLSAQSPNLLLRRWQISIKLPATFTHEFALRSTHVESLALKN